MVDRHLRDIITLELNNQLSEAYPKEIDINKAGQAIADKIEAWGYMHYSDAAPMYGFSNAQEGFNHAAKAGEQAKKDGGIRVSN